MDNKIEKRESENIEKSERTRSGRVFVPNVDIVEKTSEILLIADLPGAEEKSIDITLENKQLVIEACVDQKMPEGLSLNYAEYNVGDYVRAFTLTDDIDRDKIRAKYQNGVLRLHLPKAEAAKAKKIAVSVG